MTVYRSVYLLQICFDRSGLHSINSYCLRRSGVWNIFIKENKDIMSVR